MAKSFTTSASEPLFGLAVGVVNLANIHEKTTCAGTACVIHNPSEHHMRDWPTHWRGDKRQMERTCSHGVGHPDPDDLAFHKGEGRAWMGVHGCDGCCSPGSG